VTREVARLPGCLTAAFLSHHVYPLFLNSLSIFESLLHLSQVLHLLNTSSFPPYRSDLNATTLVRLALRVGVLLPLTAVSFIPDIHCQRLTGPSASMAHHLLGLPLELRMLIWMYALVGVSDIVHVWENVDRPYRFYLACSGSGASLSSKPQDTTSLLRLCRQVYAEAISIFHQHVPLLFKIIPCRPDRYMPDWLRLIGLTDFRKASLGLKSMILPMRLALALFSSRDAQHLLGDFPQLQTLVIYDSCDASDVPARSSSSFTAGRRGRTMGWINRRCMNRYPRAGLDFRMLYSNERSYTIIHQAFVTTAEVCFRDSLSKRSSDLPLGLYCSLAPNVNTIRIHIPSQKPGADRTCLEED
jgi:hypothetical protein